MIVDLLAQAEVGQYFAIWKIIIFLPLFMLWAWVGQWIDTDAANVKTSKSFWVNIYLGLGLFALVQWFMLPAMFFIGFAIYLVVWITVSFVYITHRNARVDETKQVLTRDHIKFVISRGKSEKAPDSQIELLSALGNTLPVPMVEDDEYDGYFVVDALLYEICMRRVSKLEWVSSGEEIRLRSIVDGMAGGIEQHDKEEYFPGLAYLKAVAGLDVDDKRRPQSGVFSVKIEGDTYNWRIDTAGSTRGENMSLTLVEQTDVIDVDSIGFNFDQIDSVKEKLAEKRGIFVVSGPKGSGVSSMLYSMIRNHDGFTENIFSYEKELLCEIDNITQNLVESEDVSDDVYHKGLRSIFLADPDAVMVGFCKNEQMAKGATDYVHAEKQKKLYIANEAPTVFHALQNWIKMVGDAKKIADTLSVVTCQRLVRKLCTHCREAYIPDPALLKKLNLPSEKIKHFYRPPTEEEIDKNGEPILCENCQGIGYYGRTAVIETLILTDDLKAMIAKKAPVNTLRVQCRKEKMLYMQEQALRKVIEGVTSIQEVSRVTNEAKPKAKKSSSKT